MTAPNAGERIETGKKLMVRLGFSKGGGRPPNEGYCIRICAQIYDTQTGRDTFCLCCDMTLPLCDDPPHIPNQDTALAPMPCNPFINHRKEDEITLSSARLHNNQLSITTGLTKPISGTIHIYDGKCIPVLTIPTVLRPGVNSIQLSSEFMKMKDLNKKFTLLFESKTKYGGVAFAMQ